MHDNTNTGVMHNTFFLYVVGACQHLDNTAIMIRICFRGTG